MDQGDRIGLQGIERGRASGHAAGVPVLELAAGDQHHRIVGVGALVGGNDVGRNEAAPAGFAREAVDEDDRIARVAFVAARVGHRVLALEPLPGDAGDVRHRVPHLVEDLRHRLIVPVEAELTRHLLDDPEVLARVARRVDRLAAELDEPVGVGEGARLLRERARRQDDVGEVGRLGEEDVLHDEMLERRERSRAWFASGSDIAGFSPITYMPRILPCLMACITSTTVSPGFCVEACPPAAARHARSARAPPGWRHAGSRGTSSE